MLYCNTKNKNSLQLKEKLRLQSKPVPRTRTSLDGHTQLPENHEEFDKTLVRNDES